MKRFFSIIISLLLCCSFLFTSASAAFENSGDSTSTVYGHTYKYNSSIGKDDSTGVVYGVTNITSTELIPVGYCGICARLYTSTGTLAASTSWHYNNYEVQGVNSGFLYAPSSGTYYSKGQVRFYNGDGYNTYNSKASPNMTQYNSISMSASHLQTNQTGLTYGSALLSETEPDLILAEGISGNIGYVKSSDLNGPMPVTAYNAIQMQPSQSRAIPVYESDGITVIDTFVIDAATPIYSF